MARRSSIGVLSRRSWVVGSRPAVFGKVANIVVWSGDPFEFTTGVEHVLIRGKEIPLKSRQTELFERYKKLPPNY